MFAWHNCRTNEWNACPDPSDNEGHDEGDDEGDDGVDWGDLDQDDDIDDQTVLSQVIGAPPSSQPSQSPPPLRRTSRQTGFRQERYTPSTGGITKKNRRRGK